MELVFYRCIYLRSQSKYKRYLIGVSPSDNTIFKLQTDIDHKVIHTLNEGDTFNRLYC